MDWDIIQGLIDARLFLVLGACWAIGYMLKQTPNVPDWSIIFVVTAVAIVLTLLTLGLTVESVVQGILVGAVAVYSNQVVKQIGKRGDV
jgi:uncharacterized membrane protein YoaK (UPF0700 family)